MALPTSTAPAKRQRQQANGNAAQPITRPANASQSEGKDPSRLARARAAIAAKRSEAQRKAKLTAGAAADSGTVPLTGVANSTAPRVAHAATASPQTAGSAAAGDAAGDARCEAARVGFRTCLCRLSAHAPPRPLAHPFRARCFCAVRREWRWRPCATLLWTLCSPCLAVLRNCCGIFPAVTRRKLALSLRRSGTARLPQFRQRRRRHALCPLPKHCMQDARHLRGQISRRGACIEPLRPVVRSCRALDFCEPRYRARTTANLAWCS